MKKYVFSIMMLFLPMLASADNSGVCGDGLTFSFVSETNTLTISKTGEGTGKMYDYELVYNPNTYMSEPSTPWYSSLYDLNYVVIEDGVTHIGNYAFYNCSRIMTVDIPQSLTTIGDYAFCDCSLKSISIPSGVTSIGESAFSRTSINNIYITDLEAWYNIEFNGSFNPMPAGYHLILNNEEITEFVIPEGTTTLKDYIFAGCQSLVSVTLPETLTHIGRCSFNGCLNLQSLVIPSSVTTIDISAFNSCGLTSIVIPPSVISLGEGAFANCQSLKSITFSGGISTIGHWVFSSCLQLSDVYCLSEEVFGESTFGLFDHSPVEDATLHVPASAIDAYKAAAPWNQFKEVVPLTEQEMSVEGIKVDDQASEWYQLDGRKSFGPKRGLNIIRMKDGTTKKVLF